MEISQNFVAFSEYMNFNVRATVRISSILVTFLENMNFKNAIIWDSPITGQKSTRTYAELQDNVSKVPTNAISP